MKPSIQRILVVGPAWVGDMVMSQVIYAALRRRYPNCTIDVLAPAATLSLVKRMPEINRGILIDQKHGEFGFSYRQNLGTRLKEEAYDWAIVTPNSLKSALVPFFADIPLRTGFLGEYRYFLLNDIKLMDKRRLPLMTDRFLALIGESGESMQEPALMVDTENQQAFLAKLRAEEKGIGEGRPVIGFCPGAEFGDAKKWPEAHYAELARSLIAQGHAVWIFGSPADEATGRAISAAAGEGCVNLAGKTSLVDAIDLLALCEAVVTNDSGLMHIAAAVGVRVVAIYGSTSPGFTPPLSGKATTLSLGLECSPCFKRTCPLGHKNCLNQLSAAMVLDALVAGGGAA